jgi:peptidoglycan L-alanyl-D-glutamate endopeptidase CwlK
MSRYSPFSGFRSVEEQNNLFAQGRPGGPPGPIVTKAKGGQSAHNFGCAIDFCRDADMTRAGLQMDWDTEHYRILSEEASRAAAESGFGWAFQDAPHVQLPLKAHGIELFDVRAAKCLLNAYRAGGMAAVNSILNSETW